MARPVIGIPAQIEQARWGPWLEDAHLLPRAYVDAVHAAGGAALLLPADPEWEARPEEVLALLDGLLLAGGADVDPAAYGADAHEHSHPGPPERDHFELALARGAIERDLPLLGICRGMQVLNVARGGTLHQHLPEVVGDERHRHTPGVFADHHVRVEPGSHAARAAGGDHHPVKSHHHQAVERLGEGLVVTGRSEEDGLVEAIELPERRFVLGVQWHPEADEVAAPIAELVAWAAGARSPAGA